MLAATDIVDHFIESTIAVFGTMVGCDLSTSEQVRESELINFHDVQSSIAITGDLQATVLVCLDQQVAFAAVEAFLGEKPSTLDGDVFDLVGEIANMIGGRAKERMNFPNSRLGLPVPGPYSAKATPPSAMNVQRVTFRAPWGPLSIAIGVPQLAGGV